MAVIPEDQHLLGMLQAGRDPRARSEKAQQNQRAIESLAKPRKSKPNQWETLFAEWLEEEKRAGRIYDWGQQRVSLRLPGGTWYRPDFDVRERNTRVVVVHDCAEYEETHRVIFYEVKGFLREKARIKMREAAVAFPWATFQIAYRSTEGRTGTCPFKLLTVAA